MLISPHVLCNSIKAYSSRTLHKSNSLPNDKPKRSRAHPSRSCFVLPFRTANLASNGQNTVLPVPRKTSHRNGLGCHVIYGIEHRMSWKHLWVKLVSSRMPRSSEKQESRNGRRLHLDCPHQPPSEVPVPRRIPVQPGSCGCLKRQRFGKQKNAGGVSSSFPHVTTYSYLLIRTYLFIHLK